jgi:hypothetical protein
MKFTDIFKDENSINEKNVVGFASFAIMVIFAIVDIIAAWMGKELIINDIIFNSFLIVTLGSFGIAEVGKIFGKTKSCPEVKKDEISENK